MAADRVVDETSLPFEMGRDALCFRNADPDLAKTDIPILGRLGVKKGVCQGIAGLSAAFRENVEFVPDAPAESPSAVEEKIDRAVRANRARSRERVRIGGYSSLFGLCAANRMEFLKKSVWLNLEIAMADIVPVLPEFERLKKDPVASRKNALALRRELGETLARVRSELREGHYPLLLSFSHVVLVRAYRTVAEDGGGLRVDLEVYDSNHPEALRTIAVPFASDGLPAGSNPMRWILHTPESRN